VEAVGVLNIGGLSAFVPQDGAHLLAK
jgi:hypothetical protein